MVAVTLYLQPYINYYIRVINLLIQLSERQQFNIFSKTFKTILLHKEANALLPYLRSGFKGESETLEIHTWRGRRHTQLQCADVESQ